MEDKLWMEDKWKEDKWKEGSSLSDFLQLP